MLTLHIVSPHDLRRRTNTLNLNNHSSRRTTPINISNTPVHLLNSSINNLRSATLAHLHLIITNSPINLRASRVQAVRMVSRVPQAQYQATEETLTSLHLHLQVTMAHPLDRAFRLVVPIPQTSTCNLDLLVSLCVSLSKCKGKDKFSRMDLRDLVVSRAPRSLAKVNLLHSLSL